jgi:hypothetical protein
LTNMTTNKTENDDNNHGKITRLVHEPRVTTFFSNLT